MIKFSGTDRETKVPLLGIGLSRANCEALLAGRPIRFSTLGMDGLPTIEVIVMAGETETSMAQELMDIGAITRDKIHEDPAPAEPSAPLKRKDVN